MTIRLETSLFCTDEDIATRFRGDYESLCAREYLASGTDGAFSAGSPWTLTSASTHWISQGVIPGSVVALRSPATQFGSAGALLAVDSVAQDGSSVTLRRLNMAAGTGLPPGVGGVSNVSFAVPTMRGLIENATYDIERRYGINALISGRTVASMFDLREVRNLCVLTVVIPRFLDLARQASANQDLYFAKYGSLKSELDDLLARVVIHWTASPDPSSQTARVGRLTR